MPQTPPTPPRLPTHITSVARLLQGSSIFWSMGARKQADLVEAFNTFDEDQSGLIDVQELIRCLR